MDVSLDKSFLGETAMEESKPSESNGDEKSCVEEIVFHQVAEKIGQENDGTSTPSPSQKDLNCSKQLDEQLGSTKAEMDGVMEENQRLKLYLDRVLKDYRTLEMQYKDVIERDHSKESHRTNCDHVKISEHEQIDLSLGIGDTRKATKINNVEERKHKHGLSLGLDSKFDFPDKSPVERSPNVIEEVKEEAGERWAPKGIKKMREGGDDEILQQNPTKRARVSVRVRCDTPTMNDGCQWRKYGQKIAKGNPCPRAYYRCTVSPSCPVRKQVQRCVDDMSILITTYEGTHNHPLPISASAMASTTSAAASMLISGSSTSGTGPSSLSSSATVGDLNSLKFYLSENSTSKPAFYLPSPSMSSSLSFPTITLDFTSSSHLSQLGAFFPRYQPTNLNFSYLESNPIPVSYSQGMLSYGPQTQNKNQTATSLSFGSQLSYLQKTIPNPNEQSLGPDTIAAATKAITSDPSFQSVLAAALTSIMGGPGGSAAPSGASQDTDPFSILSSFPSSSNANKCAPSFKNKSSSSASSQPAGLMLLSHPFPFSSSNKSKSNSTGDNSDHVV